MPSECSSVDSKGLPNLEDLRIDSLSSYESLKDLDLNRLSLSQFPLPPNTKEIDAASNASNASYQTSRHTSQSSNHSTTLNISVNISFTKGSRLFKLRYRQITLDKHSDGSLRHLRLHDDASHQPELIHSFPFSTLPTPHIEQPHQHAMVGPFVISFLGEQVVQTAQVVFAARPHYSFTVWDDCIAFQQALLGEELIFIAGVLKAKSKGRGEECISQNIRVTQSTTGRKTLLFFANAQRSSDKRYVSIPQYAIDEVDAQKRSKDRVTVKFVPDANQTLTNMKSLTIDFFDARDKSAFLNLMN